MPVVYDAHLNARSAIRNVMYILMIQLDYTVTVYLIFHSQCQCALCTAVAALGIGLRAQPRLQFFTCWPTFFTNFDAFTALSLTR